jgi:hypothetical protein
MALGGTSQLVGRQLVLGNDIGQRRVNALSAHNSPPKKHRRVSLAAIFELWTSTGKDHVTCIKLNRTHLYTTPEVDHQGMGQSAVPQPARATTATSSHVTT